MELGVIIGVSAGILLLAVLTYYSLWQKKAFDPLPTGKIPIEDSPLQFFAIREKTVNLFIITDGEHYIMIDVGYGKKNLLQDFAELNLDPQKISHIFITHADLDHIGGRTFFPKAIFYLHKEELQIIDGTTHRFKKCYRYPPVEHPFTLLTNGSEYRVGRIHIKAIHTPGHTPGSTSYLINDSFLFTGDTIILREGMAHPFLKFISMDFATQKESIHHLAKLEHIRTLFTAHSEFTCDFDQAMAKWK